MHTHLGRDYGSLRDFAAPDTDILADVTDTILKVDDNVNDHTEVIVMESSKR
jgi:hypothetical protein